MSPSSLGLPAVAPGDTGSARSGPQGNRLLVLLFAACWPGLTEAGEASEATERPHRLPPWIIEERAGAIPTAAELPWGSASVLDGAVWTQRSVATLTEALRWAPGLLFQESFGGFEPPRLSIRGSGLDSAPTSRGVALLVDDLPLGRADGEFHSGLFDPQLFAQVEVVRGSLHAANAPAALGGAIRAFASAETSAAISSGKLEFGSFGRTQAHLHLQNESLQLAGSWGQSDGWRPHSRQTRTIVTGSWVHAPSAERHLAVSAYLAGARYEVPGPLTLANARLNPESISAAVERSRPRRDSDLVRVAARFTLRQPEQLLSGGIALQRSWDKFVQLPANGVRDSRSDDVALTTTLSRDVTWAGLDHQLLGRATLSAGVVEATRSLNDRGERGPRFATYRAPAQTRSVSLEDAVSLRPNLTLLAGVTLADARRTIADRSRQPGSTEPFDRTLRSEALSPRLTSLWRVRPGLTLHAGVSRGYEPPTIDDLLATTGPPPRLMLQSRSLQAQRATTLELGARGQQERLGWELVLYQSEWDNEILRLADESGLPRGAVNAGRTQHAGLEAAGSYRILDHAHQLTARAVFTVTDLRFDRDPVYGDNRLAGVPPRAGSAELAYRHESGRLAAIEATWIGGRIPVDHAGRLHYDGHLLVHARLGWRLGAACTVFVSTRNLFDRVHVASTAGVLDLARAPATTAIFLPGAPRSFCLGLEWSL